MSESVMSMAPRDLEAALMRSFTDGADWPLDDASLNALLDMGLSVDDVARYFGVDPVEVRSAFERARRPVQK